jgi:hypothetical protein
MGLTNAERETTIRWSRDSQDVHVHSTDPAVWARMARLGIQPARETTGAGKTTGRFYRLPVRL